MNYKVGQIIFMSNPNVAQIIPLKIVEQIIKTTEKGKETEYTVRFPDRSKTEANINALKGSIFNSIAEVENFMIENSTKAIKEMVSAAGDLQNQAFPSDTSKEESKELKEPSKDDKINAAYVDLGNGTKGKIDMKSLQKLVK